mmetsp:Transcript_132478/g.255190  ORF Transcript_132478/g.255190 Transcript_132478/m.255190 type:complete len:330 (+) Transcript_132478:141-1130(+)
MEENPEQIKGVKAAPPPRRGRRCCCCSANVACSIVIFFSTMILLLAGALLFLYLFDPDKLEEKDYELISWICVGVVCASMLVFVLSLLICARSPPTPKKRPKTYGEMLREKGQIKEEVSPLRIAAQDKGPVTQTLPPTTPPTDEEARRMTPEAKEEVPLPPGTPEKIPEDTAEFAAVKEKLEKEKLAKEGAKEAVKDAPPVLTPSGDKAAAAEPATEKAAAEKAAPVTETPAPVTEKPAEDKPVADKAVIEMAEPAAGKPAAAAPAAVAAAAAAPPPAEKVEVMEAGDSDDDDVPPEPRPASATGTVETAEFDKTLDDILNIDDEEESV